MSLEGQKVFVIGGSSGIGLETARLARDAGAEVFIGSRSQEKLDAAAADIGNSVRTVQVDVLSDDSLQAAFAATGTVDHVVFTPPGGTVGKIREIDTEEVLRGLDAKIVAAVRTAKYADIKEGGSLTYITGQFARRPMPGWICTSRPRWPVPSRCCAPCASRSRVTACSRCSESSTAPPTSS